MCNRWGGIIVCERMYMQCETVALCLEEVAHYSGVYFQR